MARVKDFNPKDILVVRKAKGMALGGKRYNQGDPIDDDCISLRKRRQLYARNLVCHPWELDKKSIRKEEDEEADTSDSQDTEKEKTEDSQSGYENTQNGDDRSQNENEGSESENNSEAEEKVEEASEKKPVRRRRRSKKTSDAKE